MTKFITATTRFLVPVFCINHSSKLSHKNICGSVKKEGYLFSWSVSSCHGGDIFYVWDSVKVK